MGCSSSGVGMGFSPRIPYSARTLFWKRLTLIGVFDMDDPGFVPLALLHLTLAVAAWAVAQVDRVVGVVDAFAGTTNPHGDFGHLRPRRRTGPARRAPPPPLPPIVLRITWPS